MRPTENRFVIYLSMGEGNYYVHLNNKVKEYKKNLEHTILLFFSHFVILVIFKLNDKRK